MLAFSHEGVLFQRSWPIAIMNSTALGSSAWSIALPRLSTTTPATHRDAPFSRSFRLLLDPLRSAPELLDTPECIRGTLCWQRICGTIPLWKRWCHQLSKSSSASPASRKWTCLRGSARTWARRLLKMRGFQTHATCNDDFNGESDIDKTRRERDSWYGDSGAANITPTNNDTAKVLKERRRELGELVSTCTAKAKAESHVYESWHNAIEPLTEELATVHRTWLARATRPARWSDTKLREDTSHRRTGANNLCARSHASQSHSRRAR